MIQSIAFFAYAVSDIKTARLFYENTLGLTLARESGVEWFEYDIGDTTFAITTADDEHPVPVRGAVVGFEVPDLEAEVIRLRKLGASFRGEATETPICRFAILLDPDSNEIIIHQKKTINNLERIA
jgi:predicted enzyme related to lactoylglutathione lyase